MPLIGVRFPLWAIFSTEGDMVRSILAFDEKCEFYGASGADIIRA